MTRKLNITVNNAVMSILDVSQNNATSKRIRIDVRFPATPSIPYLYLTEGMTSGSYSIEEFLNVCPRVPTPTTIGAYVRFASTSANVFIATMRRSYIGGISYSRYAGGRYTPLIFCKMGFNANVSVLGSRVTYNASLAGQTTGAGIYWRT